MELGLTGRNALILASSRGLGKACAEALAREGANVVINGRTSEDVEATAAQLLSYGTTVTPVVIDATTPKITAKPPSISRMKSSADEVKSAPATKTRRKPSMA